MSNHTKNETAPVRVDTVLRARVQYIAARRRSLDARIAEFGFSAGCAAEVEGGGGARPVEVEGGAGARLLNPDAQH